jgi:hypothetical protein
VRCRDGRCGCTLIRSRATNTADVANGMSQLRLATCSACPRTRCKRTFATRDMVHTGQACFKLILRIDSVIPCAEQATATVDTLRRTHACSTLRRYRRVCRQARAAVDRGTRSKRKTTCQAGMVSRRLRIVRSRCDDDRYFAYALDWLARCVRCHCDTGLICQ